MAQWVKNLPTMLKTQATQIQSLGREDLLEEEMAIHSSILAWKIPWTEEPDGLSSKVSQQFRHGWATEHASLRLIRQTYSFLRWWQPHAQVRGLMSRWTECRLGPSPMSPPAAHSGADSNLHNLLSWQRLLHESSSVKQHVSPLHLFSEDFSLCFPHLNNLSF